MKSGTDLATPFQGSAGIFPSKFLAAHNITFTVKELKRPATGYYFFDAAEREGCIAVAEYLTDAASKDDAACAAYRSTVAELVGYHFVTSAPDRQTGRVLFSYQPDYYNRERLCYPARLWAASYLISPTELQFHLNGLHRGETFSVEDLAVKFCVTRELVLIRLALLAQSTANTDRALLMAINTCLSVPYIRNTQQKYRIVG